MRSHDIVRLVGILGVIVGIGAVGMAPAAAATPQDNFPAAYYGEVTINGDPAPAGTVIEAAVNGTVRGTITTEQEGAYGGPELTDRKLEVNGTAPADTGAPVVFYIDGPSTDRTVVDQPGSGAIQWESGAHERVDLSVTVPTDPGSGGDDGDSSTGDDGDSSTGGGAPAESDDDSSTEGQTEQETPTDSGGTAGAAPAGTDDDSQGSVSDDTQFGLDNLDAIPVALVLLTVIVAILVALAVKQRWQSQDDDMERL